MASGTCGENLTWTLDNGTLTISGTGFESKLREGNDAEIIYCDDKPPAQIQPSDA